MVIVIKSFLEVCIYSINFDHTIVIDMFDRLNAALEWNGLV